MCTFAVHVYFNKETTENTYRISLSLHKNGNFWKRQCEHMWNGGYYILHKTAGLRAFELVLPSLFVVCLQYFTLLLSATLPENCLFWFDSGAEGSKQNVYEEKMNQFETHFFYISIGEVQSFGWRQKLAGVLNSVGNFYWAKSGIFITILLQIFYRTNESNKEYIKTRWIKINDFY